MENIGQRSVDYLIVSYATLPLPRPRSYQIAKLLTHLKGKFFLITAEYTKSEKLDFSLDSYQRNISSNTIRIKDKFDNSIGSLLFNIIPALKQLPDNHLFWTPFVVKQAKKLKQRIRPKAIIAFSRPETDLLIGIKLKKIFDVPLVIHFSDPWVDNPYVRYNRFLKWANSCMEFKVIKNADLILFTNEDQQKMVMAKYPEHIQKKSHSIGHCYDETLYPSSQKTNYKFIIRHIGNLYKQRNPEPFLMAINLLIKEHPDIERRFLVEFYGQISEKIRKGIEEFSLENIVKVKPHLTYSESLKLMSGSDLLLLIDAESSYNTFFPSKLVDYVGAKKMIMGITSANGPTARIIKSYGGQIFLHNQVDLIKKSLFTLIKQNRKFHPNLKELVKYSAPTVAEEFEKLVRQVIL